MALEATDRNAVLLRIAGRAARLGGWTVELPDGRITWSDEISAIHEVAPGYAPSVQEAIDFYAPEYRAEVTRIFDESCRSGTPFDFEAQLITARGRRIWVRAIGEAVRDAAGEIVRIQGAFQDITERKDAEQSLAASQARFRELAESMPMIVWTATPDGTVDYSNHHFFDFTGASVETPAAVRWQQCVHPDDVAGYLHAWRAAIREQTPFEVERRIRRFDGFHRWFRVQAVASRDRDGEVVRWYGTATDVHDAKHLESEASRLAARLTTTLESVTDGFYTLDRAMQFTYVNREAERLLRRDRRDLLGRSIWDEFSAVVGSVFYHEVYRAIHENRTVAFEAFYPPLDRWFEVKAYPSNEGLAVYFRDATERRRAEKALAQSHRSLQLLSRCNEALVRSSDERQLLLDICRLAVSIGGYRMAWVGYAGHEPDRPIRPMASAGAELGYLAEVRVRWSEDDPTGRGPAGRAIRTGQVVSCPDIDADDGGFHWRAAARRRGYRGVISLPLHEGRHAFGVLTLYTSEVLDISVGEVKLLQELADNLAFGITGLRTRDKQRRMHEAVLTMARSVSAATGCAFFDRVTRGMVAALGADAGFVARTTGGNDEAAMLCAVVDGAIVPTFAGDFLPDVLAESAGSDVWVVPRDLARRCPESRTAVVMGLEACVGVTLVDAASRPFGLMGVLFREPLVDQEFIISTLRIFAARVAAELDRQKADARLREQASLLDKAQDAILVLDFDDRIVYWNRSAERLYGWSPAEALGRSVRDLLHCDPSAFLSAVTLTTATGEWTGEIEHVARDGRPLVVEGRWTLVRDDAGAPTSVLAIHTDITARRQLEQQYLRAQRIESIGTLAGGIAHDLNNVLAPILMSVDLLRMGESDPDRVSILSTIENSARRGADMARQVLAFARGEPGRQEDVAVGSLLADLAKIVRDTFPRNITLEEVVTPGLRRLSGDPTQLHQVLLNLLVNARDAMPHGGRIRVTAADVDIDAGEASVHLDAREGPYVAIEVEDTGSGMSAEVLDRIFDPFFTTKQVGHGTGLGLSTSMAIVRRHGGFLQVDSVVGRGSRFRVWLPAAAPAGRGAPVDKAVDLPSGQGETVLVVDDEGPIRLLAKQTLQAFGYEVLLAADGAEGIDVFRRHQSDISLVLTDLMMPVMDGLVMVEALRDLDPTIKVIGTSGVTPEADAPDLAARVGWLLPKPYSASTLTRAVATALGRN